MAETERRAETALVTGASSGIGAVIAKELAKRAFDVVLTARRTDRLQELASSLAKEHGVKTWVFAADLAVPTAPAKLVEDLAKTGIHVDMLVNNAGFGTCGPFAESGVKGEIGQIDVNVRALTELTHRLLPAMVSKKRGRIMNVASTAAFQPGPFMAVYCATKAFVLSFSEALSNELANTGVTVTCLCPGATKTEFDARAGNSESKLFKGGGVMSAEEVAASGVAAAMAGTRLVIPGFKNSFMARTVGMAPRGVVLRVARSMLAPKGSA